MDNIGVDERGLLLVCSKCAQRNRLLYERLGQSFRCGKCQNEFEALGQPVEVTSESAFEALTARSALPILVDFWAPWCGPCKMVAPELEKVAREVAGRWIVAKVNTEELPNLAQRFRISGIPTLILFGAGQELARQSGALTAALIRRFMQQAEMVQK